MSFVFCDGEGSVRSLFGVFDGHSSKAASQFASEELPGFIERRLRVLDVQERKLKGLDAPPGSLAKFSLERPKLVKEALVAAFLDADRFFLCESIILHLINGGQPGSTRTSLERCFSGSCACVVLIDRGVLYCANAGDCRAVLGVEFPVEEVRDLESDGFLDPSNDSRTTTIASALSNDHNTDNQREVARIRSTHSEEADLLSNGRIKGILKPTRHIGGALLKEPIARRFIRGESLTENWHPPYTTATPEVSYRTLTHSDRFVIIGTDGLWDLVDNQEAVSLVVEYEALRKESLIPPELNVCTFIIERALARAHIPSSSDSSHTQHKEDSCASSLKSETSTSRSELEHLSAILSLPAHMRRDIYDDISVTVIYLDTGRREQAGTAMAALSSWVCPHFPGSVDRVSKLKKALPLAKPLSRLLASGTSEAMVIKEYLEECWPDRHLDKWTTQSLSTRKFLKSFGIELSPSNAQLRSPATNVHHQVHQQQHHHHHSQHSQHSQHQTHHFQETTAASSSPSSPPSIAEVHNQENDASEDHALDSSSSSSSPSASDILSLSFTKTSHKVVQSSPATLSPSLYSSSAPSSTSSSPSALGSFSIANSSSTAIPANIAPTAAPSILDIGFGTAAE